jgi:hypothetical protein
MAAENEIGRVIEDGALEPPVIEQETARLDQIDGYPEARREPQQGPGVLRNVRFEQRETHTTSTNVMVYTRIAAQLCGSLSHSSLSSTV